MNRTKQLPTVYVLGLIVIPSCAIEDQSSNTTYQPVPNLLTDEIERWNYHYWFACKAKI